LYFEKWEERWAVEKAHSIWSELADLHVLMIHDHLSKEDKKILEE
jgi:hypothetical protein